MKISGQITLARALPLIAIPLLLAVAMPASATSHVSVSVVDGHITLSPDPLSVGDGHNVALTWEITTAGWTFTQNGVAIDADDGEFSSAERSADGLSFNEIDKDDNAESYKYTITLTDGVHTISEDPTIQNGGHP